MKLLQTATTFLLQGSTQFITNCDRYYKVRWICYKLQQVLQSAMIITNCDSTPGICQPRAFDTHAVSYQNITPQRILLEKQAD